jgi:hypothetical protein
MIEPPVEIRALFGVSRIRDAWLQLIRAQSPLNIDILSNRENKIVLKF